MTTQRNRSCSANFAATFSQIATAQSSRAANRLPVASICRLTSEISAAASGARSSRIRRSPPLASLGGSPPREPSPLPATQGELHRLPLENFAKTVLELGHLGNSDPSGPVRPEDLLRPVDDTPHPTSHLEVREPPWEPAGMVAGRVDPFEGEAHPDALQFVQGPAFDRELSRPLSDLGESFPTEESLTERFVVAENQGTEDGEVMPVVLLLRNGRDTSIAASRIVGLASGRSRPKRSIPTAIIRS